MQQKYTNFALHFTWHKMCEQIGGADGNKYVRPHNTRTEMHASRAAPW